MLKNYLSTNPPDHHDFKHIQIRIVFPAKRFLLSVIKFLPKEKLCSDGTLVAGMAR